MFLVNSRMGLVTATSFSSTSEWLHLTEALLLPKLRSHFAEFLNESFLKRLRILSSPTCVGFRYGRHRHLLRGFSWQRGINQFAALRPPYRVSELAMSRICLGHPPTRLDQHFHSLDGLPFCVTPSYKRRPTGTGILTCFPSPTPFGLGLGTD